MMPGESTAAESSAYSERNNETKWGEVGNEEKRCKSGIKKER